MIRKNFKENLFFFLSLFTIFLIFIPFLSSFLTTFKNVSEFNTLKQSIFPNNFYVGNYIDAFKKLSFPRTLSNTIVVSLMSAFLVSILSVVTGYTLTFINFKYKKLFIVALFFQLIVPFEIVIIPWLDVTGQLSLHNTLVVLTIPQIVSAFGVFFMWQTFRSIPNNITKAISLEAGNHFKILTYYILPSSKVHIKVLSLYIVLFTWESFIWPLLVNYSNDAMTLTPMLSRFSSNYATNYPLFISASFIISLPYCIIGFLLLKNTLSSNTDYL